MPNIDTVLLSALTSVRVPESSPLQHKVTKTDVSPPTQGSCGFDETALCTGKVLNSSV